MKPEGSLGYKLQTFAKYLSNSQINVEILPLTGRETAYTEELPSESIMSILLPQHYNNYLIKCSGPLILYLLIISPDRLKILLLW